MRKTLMIVSCAILTAAGTALTGCGDNNNSTSTTEKVEQSAEKMQHSSIYNINWLPHSIANQPEGAVPDGVFVAFDQQNKRIYGNAGVNRFTASYELPDGEHQDGKKNKIKISPAAVTLMAGPSEAMKYETTFLQNLDSIDGYSVLDGDLNLYSGDTLVGSFKNGGPVSTEKVGAAPQIASENSPETK